MTTTEASHVFIGDGGEDLIKSSSRTGAGIQSRQLKAYAPPMTWGPSVTVGSHVGKVTFTISYEADGDTLVMGRVKYFKDGSSSKVIEEFKDNTRITTSNSVGNVDVEFKGIVTGSAVTITVSP